MNGTIIACLLGLSLGLSGCNKSPEAQIVGSDVVEVGKVVDIHAMVNDPDNDPITLIWGAQNGTVSADGPTGEQSIKYTAPNTPGSDIISVVLSDGRGGTGKETLHIQVVRPPPSVTPPTAAKPTATIANVQNNDGVPHVRSLEGTHAQLPEKSKLWILVQPEKSPSWHPQSMALEGTDGTWTATAWIGIDENQSVGENFTIHVVVADEAASKAFADYKATAEKTKAYPGLRDLPSGAVGATKVRVTRVAG